MGYKLIKRCVVCDSIEFERIFAIDNICLTGFFPKINEADPISTPITLNMCGNCGNVQMREMVNPELMFRDYWYRSGTTNSMKAHLKRLVDDFFVPGGVLLDIGCNDGTLMQYAAEKKMTVYGCDPSSAVDDVPEELKSRVVNDFFDPGTVRNHLSFLEGKVDLVTAVSMFYDVAEPKVFLQLVSGILKKTGRAVIEVNYAKSFFERKNIDMLGQEHLVYYFIGTFERVCKSVNLVLIDAYCTDMNGGNITFVIANEPLQKSKRLKNLIDEEEVWIQNFDFFGFQKTTMTAFGDFKAWVEKRAKNRSVKMLGASTRGALIAQIMGLDKGTVKTAVDLQVNKKGCRVPGTDIPIEYDPEHTPPDDYLVMPYQFKAEIIDRYLAFLKNGGELFFYRPTFSRVKFCSVSKKVREIEIPIKLSR